MHRGKFHKPLLAMTFAFLLVFQTIVGVFPFQSTYAEGVEIKEDFLKNVIVKITDEHNTVTVDVYDRSVTEGVYDFDLGTTWDQDVKVDLTYEFALAEKDRDLIHENGGKGIFEFDLPAQFKLVGAHGGPLIDRGMEIGSYETSEGTGGTIRVTVHFDHPTYFNEFDNITGNLYFSTIVLQDVKTVF